MGVNIVLCADRNVDVGVAVTLLSALQSTEAHLSIYLVHDDIDDARIARIRRSLSGFEQQHVLYPISFPAERLPALRSLRGNNYTYARLEIGSLLQDVSRVIYLDTDLIVRRDLAELFDIDLKGHLFGAVPHKAPESSTENKYFKSIGVGDGRADVFNAGVVLYDLDMWRETGAYQEAMEFAVPRGGELPTLDQTILNYLSLKRGFLPLDDHWNYYVRAESRQLPPPDTRAVFHFLSTPKPWGIGAEVLHGGYRMWHDVLIQTDYKDYQPSLDLRWSRLMYAARSARGYYGAIRQRMFGARPA